jgi:hydroxylamine reductase
LKSGAIRHFFLVAGCDGAKPGRNYYTDFVRQTPPDTVVLTLACGKYRFNDLDLAPSAGCPASWTWASATTPTAPFR